MIEKNSGATKKHSCEKQFISRVVLFVVIAISSLAFSSCAILGPDHKTPETDFPQDWTARESELFRYPSAEEAQAWWTLFNDNTLNQLVSLTFKGNLTLQSAAVRIFEARAQLGIVRGNLYPQSQELGGDLTTIGVPSPADERYYNAASIGFDVGWELDFWGKFRRSIQSAEANLRSVEAQYDDLVVSLTAEVARTYIDIRTVEERIRLAQKNAELQEESLKIVTLQFQAGVVTELDILQAKTLLSSTRATIPSLQATLARYKNSLAILLGMFPGELEPYLEEQSPIPSIKEAIAMEIPAELLRRRPDVRSSEMLAAAQSAQIGIAQAELYPSFTLFGSIGWSANDIGSNELGDIFESNNFSYSFGPTFRWNLFHYGRLKNQVRVQDARYQQALLAYQETVLNAAREVEDAMKTLSYTVIEAQHLLEGIETSEKSTRLSMLQYEEGLADYQRVLDATRSRTQRQDQYAQVQGRIATTVVSLYKSFGGGWQVTDESLVLPDSLVEQMATRTDWGTLLPTKVDLEVPTK